MLERSRSERGEGEREGGEEFLRPWNVRTKGGKDWKNISRGAFKRSGSLLCKYQSRRQQTNVFERITSLLWIAKVFMLITLLTLSYRCSAACFKVLLFGAFSLCRTMKKILKLTIIRCFISRIFQEGHYNSTKIALQLVCQCVWINCFIIASRNP